MKRFWGVLCLLVCVCASACAVSLPAGAGTVEIMPRMHGEEAWLYLPAFANVQRLYPDAQEADGVWMDEASGLHLMKSENIPALFLFSSDPENEGREYIESSTNHSTYTTASMALVDADGSVIHFGDIRKLRGRGNGTWKNHKKPYQFKLEERADLLENGEAARTWVLLSESTDGTLLHNRIALDLALEMGMEETSHSRHVDLYYDGDYRGTYLLVEKVEMGENRVSGMDYDDLLETWNNKVGQRDLSVLALKTAENRFGQSYTFVDGVVESHSPDAGAYLVELRNDTVVDKGRSHFYTSDGSCFESKNPENATNSMMEHVSALMQEGLDALIHGGVNPETGRKAEEIFDVDSFARALLVNELSYNLDGFTYASSYFVLPEGSRQFRAGPVWDIDLAWRYMYDHSTDGGVGFKSFKPWMSHFYGAQVFVDAMRSICQNELVPMVRTILLGEKQGQYLKPLDEYAEWIADSIRMNDHIWNVQKDWRLVYADDFDGEIELLRQFISERIVWLENALCNAHPDPETISLIARTNYMRMEDKFTLNIEPFSRASIRFFTLKQETEADEKNYALWRLDAVIDPAPGHAFEYPSVTLNGMLLSCEKQEDGSLRISALLEDASYRPVDYYGEDIGLVYDYETYVANYPEVAEECEYDPELVMDYFYLDGMYEGHVANAFFDPAEILRTNTELRKTLGEDWWSYYTEFCMYGWEKEWLSRIKHSYEPKAHDAL